MKASELISALKTKATEKLAALQAEVDAFGELETAVAADIKEGSDAAYDEGFAKGAESVGNPDGTKQFSLEELNAEIKLATDPLNAQVADLSVRVADLQAQLDAKPELDEEAIKSEAVAAFKADIAAKYDEMQVAETEKETGFGNLLK